MQGCNYLLNLLLLISFGAINAQYLNSSICKGVPPEDIVLLPHPENCSLYIQCANEVPVIMPCPDGLHWNAKIKECDYPEVANCEINKTDQNQQHNEKVWSNCKNVPENINVLLPNSEDCGSFIQCVHQTPVVMRCPVGLHWSISTNRCDWPNIANCKVGTCDGVSENEDVLLPNPKDCATYIQCVHQKPVVRPCPEGLHWNAAAKKCDWVSLANCQSKQVRFSFGNIKWSSCDGVPETIDVLLPNPNNCSSYIQCVHQKPVIRPCPEGLHWNNEMNYCDWPENANCKLRSCENVPETEDVLLPNPNDCGSYIQCVHQKPVVRPCPQGLHWSVVNNRCDWPNIAQCNVM